MHKYESMIIKQSPIVIVKNYLVLQFAAVAAFFLARVLADYGELYKNFLAISPVPYHLAESIGLFVLETVIVFYIFFRWYKEYYEIGLDRIVHGRGIVFRHRQVIPLESIHSLSYSQGPLGRMTKYGAIYLEDKNSGRKIIFHNMPEPQKLIADIIKLKEVRGDHTDSRLDIGELLSRDENERLEFKSSFRWDLQQNKVNKNLEKATMKTIAAFLNSNGGHLVIGVDDTRNIVGVHNDYRSLPKTNSDGFENHFTSVFHNMIGPEFRQFVKLSSHKINDKEFCLVAVFPSTKPVYLKSEEKEEFYIRTGNGTTPLKLSEVTAYLDSRWQ